MIGAILFEATMDRDFGGKPAPTYLWEVKQVVPFLKIDKGLADEKNGVQLMKPIAGLDALLKKAKAKGIFGTKERSVIKQAKPEASRPSSSSSSKSRSRCSRTASCRSSSRKWTSSPRTRSRPRRLLKAAITKALDKLLADQQVMLKLTIPEVDNLYARSVKHPRVLKVVALSGGYSREEANKRLARKTA